MAVLKDYWNTGGVNVDRPLYSTYKEGQVFTASETYTVDSVKVKLERFGSTAYTVHCAIYSVSGSPGLPNALLAQIDKAKADLPTPADWVTFDFLAEDIELASGTDYAIVMWMTPSAGYSNRVDWPWEKPGNYANGYAVHYSAGWGVDVLDGDYMFEVWGGAAEDNGGAGIGEGINDFVGKLFGWDLRYKEEWFTDLVSYDTGKEQRNQIWERPKRHWILPYNVLLQEYRDKLKELCSRAKGIYNVFLFEDPYDYECALTECIITAVAAQVDFQLIKTYYGSTAQAWSENKTRIQPNTIFQPIIEVNDEAKIEGTDYDLDYDTGIVTFGVAPGVNKVITANYRFYCPVRFDRDAYEEMTLHSGVWNMGDIPIAEVIE